MPHIVVIVLDIFIYICLFQLWIFVHMYGYMCMYINILTNKPFAVNFIYVLKM